MSVTETDLTGHLDAIRRHADAAIEIKARAEAGLDLVQDMLNGIKATVHEARQALIDERYDDALSVMNEVLGL